MWCAGTLLTIYVIDSYILSRFRTPTLSTGKLAVMLLCSIILFHINGLELNDCMTSVHVLTFLL